MAVSDGRGYEHHESADGLQVPRVNHSISAPSLAQLAIGEPQIKSTPSINVDMDQIGYRSPPLARGVPAPAPAAAPMTTQLAGSGWADSTASLGEVDLLGPSLVATSKDAILSLYAAPPVAPHPQAAMLYGRPPVARAAIGVGVGPGAASVGYPAPFMRPAGPTTMVGGYRPPGFVAPAGAYAVPSGPAAGSMVGVPARPTAPGVPPTAGTTAPAGHTLNSSLWS